MSRNHVTTALTAVLLTGYALVVAKADDRTARCASLASQWNAAKIEKASSPNLGRAKAWAKSGTQDCAKGTPSRQDDGANEYIQALKLLGVAPKQ